MSEEIKLKNPWLIAAWPGMGHVAISAGYYLMAKLGMHLQAEFGSHSLFEIESVDVKGGLIHMGRWPLNRFFVWKDPKEAHDLILFIGEAQPPLGKYAYCCKLIEYAKNLGVERIITFAAMATPMHHEQDSRVFAVATDQANLDEMRERGLVIVENGQIGGLNGIILGVGAGQHLQGACLLGEVPHIFAQLPYPKASLAVLQVFAKIANIELDLTELSLQADQVEENLNELLSKVQEQNEIQEPHEEQPIEFEPQIEEQADVADLTKVEQLFMLARKDRTAAYELKRELDRLGIYQKYENRFLDLFRKGEKAD